ncbi:MAG: helix-turn-helix domain-containing protein [Actinomycetota bacterium]
MADPSENRRRTQREQTRARLLDAFDAEFREHGFANANIERVVSSLGLTRGAFYGHFDSLTDVAIELLDRARATEAPELSAFADVGLDPAGLAALFTRRVEERRRAGVQPVASRFIAELLMASRHDETLRDRIIELYDERARSFVEVIELLTADPSVELVEPARRIAHVIMALEVGFALASHLDVPDAPIFVDEVLPGLILRGAIRST